MSNDAKGFIVTLDPFQRSEDAENICNAIRMITGVLSVDPVPKNPDDFIIRMRIATEYRTKLYDVLKDAT